MKQFSFRIKLSPAILSSMLAFLTIISNAQSDLHTDLPQFLYPEFSSAVIKTKDGKSLTSEMNYNMVTGNMVIEKNGNIYDFLNVGLIDTVFLHNSKFIRFGKAFCEVIYTAPVSLYLHHSGKVVPVGKQAGYGTTSQTSSITSISSISTDAGYYNLELPSSLMVRVENIYWVKTDSNMFSFTNLRQLLKIFPDREDELKKFIKSNHVKIERRDGIIKLMSYCNDIIN